MKNRDICRWGRRAAAPAIAVGLLMVPSAGSAQTVLPDITVVAPTPLSGGNTKPTTGTAAHATTTAAPSAAPATGTPGPADLTSIDRDKVPSNTTVLTSTDFNHEYTTDFLDALNRGLPGVSLSDQTGNPFQKDLDYRGFTASPVQGTPQGIAVYQNGTRVNESWGDVVNWDFIPEKAIDKVTLFPSNPVFGLNALGGALSIQMKNGFTWQGTEVEAMAGSYGRVQSSVQVGKQDGNLAAYAFFESAYDQGWRDYAANSHINRMYMDVAGRNEEDSRIYVRKRMADCFSRYGLLGQKSFERRVPASQWTGIGDPFFFDFGYKLQTGKPDGRLKLIHAVSLQRDPKLSEALVWTFEKVLEKEPSLLTVGHEDDADRENPQVRFSLSVLEHEHIRLVPVSGFDACAQAIRAELDS